MRIAFSILFIGLFFSSSAQVDFLKNVPFEDVLAQAQKENKLILLDGYTDWCGYCKKMDREVFADEATGDFLNANFINYKLNMEKGEGPSIAKRYFIKGFPTFVVLEPSGKVRHRIVGYKPKQTFVAEAKKALGLDANKLAKMQSEYQEGKREVNFLNQYIQQLQLSQLPITEPFSDLLNNEFSDLNHPTTLKLIYKQGAKGNDAAMEFIRTNLDGFRSALKNEKMDDLFAQDALIAIVKLGNQQNDMVFDEIVNELKNYSIKVEPSLSKLSMMYYQNTSQWDAFAQSADRFIKLEKNLSPLDLNNAAWLVAQNTNSKTWLKKSLNWCNQSIAKEPKYYNHDTQGWILYKLGKTKPALAAAEQSIAMAKAEKKDYTSSLDLIKIINGLD